MNKFFKILAAFVYALLVLLICYVLGNTSFSFGEDKKLAQHLNFAFGGLFSEDDSLSEDQMFINVAYDKQLVDIYDEYGIPAGEMAITDRADLYSFLKIADEVGGYKYILLDVFFEDGLKTPVDSTLFALVAGMDNIVIPYHRDGKIADNKLMSKAGASDYSISVQDGDFGKYDYMYRGVPSVAWKMYADETDAAYSHWGPFAFCNGKLCRECMFLNFDNNTGRNVYSSSGEKILYNLGADILSESDAIDYVALLKDKYIVIGDFTENDIHNTYVGEMSGAYINYNAFVSLKEGRHYVRFWSMLLLFVIYCLISYFIISHKSLFEYVPFLRKVNSHTWRFIFSWLGFSVVLTAVSSSIYLFERNIYDILSVSFCFSALSTILELYEVAKKK